MNSLKTTREKFLSALNLLQLLIINSFINEISDSYPYNMIKPLAYDLSTSTERLLFTISLLTCLEATLFQRSELMLIYMEKLIQINAWSPKEKKKEQIYFDSLNGKLLEIPFVSLITYHLTSLHEFVGFCINRNKINISPEDKRSVEYKIIISRDKFFQGLPKEMEACTHPVFALIPILEREKNLGKIRYFNMILISMTKQNMIDVVSENYSKFIHKIEEEEEIDVEEIRSINFKEFTTFFSKVEKLYYALYPKEDYDNKRDIQYLFQLKRQFKTKNMKELQNNEPVPELEPVNMPVITSEDHPQIQSNLPTLMTSDIQQNSLLNENLLLKENVKTLTLSNESLKKSVQELNQRIEQLNNIHEEAIRNNVAKIQGLIHSFQVLYCRIVGSSFLRSIQSHYHINQNCSFTELLSLLRKKQCFVHNLPNEQFDEVCYFMYQLIQQGNSVAHLDPQVVTNLEETTHTEIFASSIESFLAQLPNTILTYTEDKHVLQIIRIMYEALNPNNELFRKFLGY